MNRKLRPQEECFAREVAKGLALTEALRVAYPKSTGWTPQTGWTKASQIAARPQVAARIKELQAAAAEQAVLESSAVLRELRNLVHSDIAGIIGPEGKVLLPHELDAKTRASVKSFEIDEFGRIKYQFWDKNAAIDKAMKHLGLFEKDNAQQAPPVIRQIRLVPLKRKSEGQGG